MVEKVSEVNVNVAMKEELTPDDNALLEHIAKKKKQDEGSVNVPLVAMLPQSALILLRPPLAQGGGQQKTEKQAAKEAAAASLRLAADPRQTKKGDGLRRQVALAVASQMATPNTGKNSVIVQKGKVTSSLSNRVEANASLSEGQSTTAQHIQAVAVVDPIIVNTSSPEVQAGRQEKKLLTKENSEIVNTSGPEVEAGRQEKKLLTKENSGEARPLWQGVMQAESMVSKQGKTATQSRNSPAMLQQLKNQTGSASGVKGENQDQTLEVNYQFQRWSGDHSVRISMPTEARREGNVTLLPSDARAADVLLRNMGHLTGLSPDLLQPQQERDEEQQQRRQHQQQDEDQE